MSRFSVLWTHILMILVAIPALAWGQEGGGEVSGGEGGEVDEDAQAFLDGQEQAPEIEAPEEEQGIGREEPPTMAFWMVGARWRMIMVPRWLLGAFFDLPAESQVPRNVTVNQAGGAEFTWRRNRLSIIGSVWWAGYFTQSDPDNEEPATDGWFIGEEAGSVDDPEFIKSEIHILFFTVDFVHSYMFTDWVGITYGGGLGFGINLHGEGGTGLYRDEATGSTAPYTRCNTPGGSPSCETDGYYQPAQDDRVWRAYPWINILLGVRFKPMRHLEINVDGGVGLGFLFGMRVNYIF